MVRVSMMFFIVFVISCDYNAKIREEESLAPKLFEARSNKMVIEIKKPTPPSPDVIPPSPDVIPPSPDVIPPSPDVIPPSPDVIPPSPDVIPPSPDVIPPLGEQKDIIAPINLKGSLIELSEKATTKEEALKQFYEARRAFYNFGSVFMIKRDEPFLYDPTNAGFPPLILDKIFDIGEWYYRFSTESIYTSMRYNPELIYSLAFAIYTMYPPRSVSKSVSISLEDKRRYRFVIKELLTMLGRMSSNTLMPLRGNFSDRRNRDTFNKYSTMEELVNLTQKIYEYSDMLNCASHKILVLTTYHLPKEEMTAERFYNIFNSLINSKNSNAAVIEVENKGREICDLLQEIFDRGKN
ncbi:hypothetical protein BOFE_08490 [Candidatus Borrelia fainii]|uniref:Lipoprotein n=1 Tax=Candidatus Borrelia fainii TaxID=2518322 RepID=A0ABM8DIQ4_9SPIR|nr:hypothetical protein [Candidatus Borrelia fainii]BDU62464.1 hypothetical protein BOFE_00040 [Candidatus Borrelia fainii]BDU63309.1 hypothetical protein BOFE_08490 [Candidatus Borrelia fainii]